MATARPLTVVGWRPGGAFSRASAVVVEDAVTTGPHEGGGDQQHDPEQDLALQELHDPDDHEDHGEYPKECCAHEAAVPPGVEPPNMTDLARQTRWLDAVAHAALIENGEVTPLELVDAAIERIEQLDPALNAVVMKWFDHAREIASAELPDGPFRGVPFLLKDL